MKAYFGRRYMVSASHRLHTPALTAEENRAAYGKCNNPTVTGTTMWSKFWWVAR